MRVLSTLVASTFLASFAAALPRPETDGAALLKRTDQQYGYGSDSSSGYSGSGSSYSGSGSGSSYSGSGSDSSYSGSGYSGSGSDSNYSGSGYSGSGSGSSGYDSSSSSSSSNYGSTSSSNDCSKDGSCNPTSTMMSDSTSTMMYDSSSAQYTSTYSTYTSQATSTMSYGSGSTNWGSSGYNDCNALPTTAPPPASYTPPSSTSGDSSGSSGGSGTTHTVIVAPTQGVLRYIPFAVNASVGDTVMFMWGANNHTVTKSSQLEICNKTSDQPFASGEQNKPFTFTQVVNDTNPIFFYCGTPGHCAKGMFGMINPPSSYMAPTSVGQMMGDDQRQRQGG
ncbi:hypothetical protein ONZ51_g4425 [Trametes cubensis]|uniref:Phytocyanin domain-containing protein n=1 Tax=Trametes cubensis TaxID=1111947 RepID=A0AAD7TYA7_9APHY|nr:hypothetical protein ONZ51_g4425 [Trametes cubensis]